MAAEYRHAVQWSHQHQQHRDEQCRLVLPEFRCAFEAELTPSAVNLLGWEGKMADGRVEMQETRLYSCGIAYNILIAKRHRASCMTLVQLHSHLARLYQALLADTKVFLAGSVPGELIPGYLMLNKSMEQSLGAVGGVPPTDQPDVQTLSSKSKVMKLRAFWAYRCLVML